MKKVLYVICAFVAIISCLSCNNGKQQVEETADSLAVETVDTALYGKIGEGTMMHTLELLTDDGQLMTMDIDEETGDGVLGGLLVGDRVSVTFAKGEDGNVAQKVINLTTLLGRWTSLDRNFTINEDGSVESNVQAESRPYTHWSMLNGQLILNADTFDVLSLGADSLSLENANGIFVYKRQK